MWLQTKHHPLAFTLTACDLQKSTSASEVEETLRAVLKVGCLLPGPELRLLAIAREDIVTKTNPFLGGFLKWE